MSKFGEVVTNVELRRTVAMPLTPLGQGSNAPQEGQRGIVPTLVFSQASHVGVSVFPFPENFHETGSIVYEFDIVLPNVALDGDTLAVDMLGFVVYEGDDIDVIPTIALVATATAKTAIGLAEGTMYRATVSYAGPFTGDPQAIVFEIRKGVSSIHDIELFALQFQYTATY